MDPEDPHQGHCTGYLSAGCRFKDDLCARLDELLGRLIGEAGSRLRGEDGDTR